MWQESIIIQNPKHSVRIGDHYLLASTISHNTSSSTIYIYTTTLGPLSLSSLLSSPVNKLTVQYKANYFGNTVNHVQKNNLYSHKEWNMSICKFKMKEKKRRYEKESDKIKLKSKKSHNELQRVRPEE